MNFIIKINDKDNVIGGLEKLVDNLDRIITDVLDTSALMIMGSAKENAPVDTGILRGSITKSNVSKAGDSYKVSVGSNVEYAPYQEYGTGIYVGRGFIYPKRSRFLIWKDRRSGKMILAKRVRGVPGKFYFKKGVEYFRANMGKIVSLLKSRISDYV
jgi:HK97 gp10 family phage protein